MPTQAELQATVNDLTKQLKNTKNSEAHYKALAQERHKQIERLAAASQAEPITTNLPRKWQQGDIHPTKGLVPKVPEGFCLAQPDKNVHYGAIVYNGTQDSWSLVHFGSEEMSKVQPSQKLWYANPELRCIRSKPFLGARFLKLELEQSKAVAPPQPKDPEWFNPDKAEYYHQPAFLQEFQQDTPKPIENIDPTDLHTAVAESRQKFASGAVRSSDASNVRYDLLSPVGMRRLAETYKEGSVKYGDNNWQKGFPMSDVMNHAMRHLFLWLDGDKTEDHLAHAAWNLITLMHFEERNPECNDVASRKST